MLHMLRGVWRTLPDAGDGVGGIPARALFYDAAGAGSWRDALVVNVDVATETYTVLWGEATAAAGADKGEQVCSCSGD